MSRCSSQIVADPVFDRSWWIYSLCRERLFTDHTETIASAFEPLLRQPNIRLLEVGCGPGLYSRRLAARFPLLQAMGVDTSERLLSRARLQAHRANLRNCEFLQRDAGSLDNGLQPADAAIASRLFLILPERERVMRAIFHTLRPGGLFFLAEPTSPLRSALPLYAMRAFAVLNGRRPRVSPRCEVLSRTDFRALVAGQPWARVQLWEDRRYQYALCEKPS